MKNSDVSILDLVSIGKRLVFALDSGKYDGITADMVEEKIKRGEIVEYLNEVLGVNMFSVLQAKGKAMQELKEYFERAISDIRVPNRGLCTLLWMVLEAMTPVNERGELIQRPLS